MNWTETIDGLPLNLFVDLQGMDETGLPWGFLTDAPDPSLIVEGAWIIAGSPHVYAVARVIDVEDGIVHVEPQRGPARKWLHLVTNRQPA